jgi:hypothetical protein
MSASIPVLQKTCYAFDPRPLEEMSSPQVGLLASSRVSWSLGLPALIASNISIMQRQRDLLEGQLIESMVLLQTVGGDCVEDMKTIAGDECLERGLGYALPKVNTLRDFLNRFHDEELAQPRPPRGHGIGWEHAHINEIAHFLDCIANNKEIAPYGATFKDGLRAIEVIEAIRLSEQINGKVEVNNH